MVQHWDAWCNLIGSLLGVLGGFYLTYDIIGGRNGPLSGMTRGVTYTLLFGIGYTTGLGLRFGLIASLGLGALLALEFFLEPRHPRSRKHRHSKSFSVVLGVGRSFFLALALGAIAGWKAGLVFFPLAAVVLSGLNLAGFAPADELHISRRLKLREKQLLASFLRGGFAGVSCWAAGFLAGNPLLTNTLFPWKFGLTIGGTSLFVGIFSPWVEGWVERTSEKGLAAIGILLVILGFILQALPNWIVLLG